MNVAMMTFGSRSALAIQTLPQLMAEEIDVAQRNSLFAQEGTKFFRALFFSVGRSSIGKRGKELLEFATR